VRAFRSDLRSVEQWPGGYSRRKIAPGDAALICRDVHGVSPCGRHACCAVVSRIGEKDDPDGIKLDIIADLKMFLKKTEHKPSPTYSASEQILYRFR
jgi:hypothetical protein